MGLFSSILSGVTGGALGDIIGASSNAKAIGKAGKAQLAATQAALAQQKSQFDTTRADNLPFLNAGQDAIGSLLQFLGLGSGGAEGQATALAGLKDSPLFTSRYDTGADTILQNAGATGGLRGGNTQNSLANFGSALFGDVFNSQIGNLLNLAQLGSGTGANLASAGQANANAQSGLLTQQGQQQAGTILGKQGVYNNLSNNLQALIASVTGGAGGGVGGGVSGMGNGGWSFPTVMN